MRAFVTGGAGCIGRHLVEAFVCRGDQFTVVHDLSSGDTADRGEAVAFVEASVTDRDSMSDALAVDDAVFHRDSFVRVGRIVGDPARKAHSKHLAPARSVISHPAPTDVRLQRLRFEHATVR
jgi:nucleoside-diphosphate-sugar epimerase